VSIVIGQTFSHYKIVGELGKGGMGEVYLAEDLHLGRRVALKFPKLGGQAHEQRFLAEARSVSKLVHSNIAQVFDYGHTPDGHPFLVMEFIDGENLQRVLSESGPLEPVRGVEITSALLSALEEAHRKQVIHRDVKPSNVMITTNGAVKVLDFGLAKQLPERLATTAHASSGELPETQTMGMTMPGIVLGTPRYMSPEQARGAAVDARTDIYSVGLVLYECLTGRPAFSATTQGEMLDLVANHTPVYPSSLRPEVPTGLDCIVMKAIEKDPTRRFQSAAEMQNELRSVSDTLLAVRLGESSWIGRVGAILTRQPLFTAFLAALLLIAPVLGILSRNHKPSPDALRWYSEGLTAIRDGTYYRASKALERSVALDGRFALAHARLAEAWSKLEYSGRAKDEMLRARAEYRTGWFSTSESRLMDAISDTLTRDFQRAITRYQEIAAHAAANEKAQAEVDLGRAYEDNEQIPQALEHYREAIRLDPEYATPFLRSGVLYGKLQRLKDAEDGFARAELLHRAANNLEGYTEVLFQRGYLASKNRKLDVARGLFEQALQISQSTGNEFQQIAATLELATVAQHSGKLPEAEEKAREGIESARRRGIALLENRGLVNLGNAFLNSGNYPAAEARYREAWESARRAAMPRLEARASFSLGSVHLQQSKVKDALSEAQAALAFFQPAGYLLETRLIELLMARAHRLLGELDLAIQSFDTALQMAEASKDIALMETAQSGRAGVLADKEALPECIAAYEKAIVLGNSLSDKTRVLLATVSRGSALWRVGRYEEAAKAFSNGEALANSPDGPRSRLWLIALNRAEMADSQGQSGDALLFARQALTLAGTERVRAARAKSVLALVLAHKGSLPDSKKLGEEGLALTPHDDAVVLLAARLRLAEIHLANSDITAAQNGLKQVMAELKAHPQPMTSFLAAMLASKAASKAGDEESARMFGRQARGALFTLKSSWGDAAFATFSARPDMRHWIAAAEKFS
jgi:serine/threonine protein kinase